MAPEKEKAIPEDMFFGPANRFGGPDVPIKNSQGHATATAPIKDIISWNEEDEKGGEEDEQEGEEGGRERERERERLEREWRRTGGRGYISIDRTALQHRRDRLENLAKAQNEEMDEWAQALLKGEATAEAPTPPTPLVRPSLLAAARQVKERQTEKRREREREWLQHVSRVQPAYLAEIS